MSPEVFDIIEESLAIESPAGPLPAVLAYPFAGSPLGGVLIIGPHPLMGGGLENNVVRGVARGMAERGFVSLRFAYCGAAPSSTVMAEFWRTGHAPDDPHRVDDARSALRRLEGVCPTPLVLVGYSFGASVIGGLLAGATATRIVLIGPTLCRHSFEDVRQSLVPKLVITGHNDFSTPLEVTRAWYDRAPGPRKLVVMDGAEHFYRGLEGRLVEEIVGWLQTPI
ncbi:MAG: hypothetical protein HY763_11570 [Planctomycetes bacterium]|nr:hypothetical protein [Planctomycetota bacterium]